MCICIQNKDCMPLRVISCVKGKADDDAVVKGGKI